MTVKGAPGEIFFSFLQKDFFSPKMDNIFLPNKQQNVEKKKAAARLAIITATRWTGNILVYGQPKA